MIIRTDVEPPQDCANRILLRPSDFDAYGAAEIFKTASGVRLSWSEPMRGVRPWTGNGELSDSDE